MEATSIQIPALRSLAGSKAIAAIAALSVAVVGFLVWLIYLKQASAYSSRAIAALPAANAAFNALSATFLIAAYRAVRRRDYARHIRFIFAALFCSTLFFASYVVYHAFHGDTKFTGAGLVRPVYFFI